MMTPANFQVVDGKGHVHAKNLTSSQANGMAEMLLATRTLGSVRTELMDKPPTTAPASAPHIVATAQPLPAIKPGSERESLCEAIDVHLDASARFDAANQAVERARAFVDARQTELDAMTAAHQTEIAASGANLAEALKAGGAAFEASRLIDRGAVLDAEVRRDTAKAALEQLTAEQVESDSTYKAAETAVRLAVMAVKRADVAAMVERLEAVKAEFTALATAIDAARFADVPMTIRAQDAVRIDVPGTGAISEAAARWHRYGAALRDDVDASWEDMQ
ncbi:hypothetical protein PQR72_27695 [Paraburkholderia madseniana]|uniref:hypothetical protein n=1 Tax=Paraburkholderia madseniana TaxID=2599607 RepID=UPI0015C5226E|nr:hypothetical protein [Paraburkholderia madseniana]NPT68080.1 hypothetical protein [Paraburkholderia madseniana]